MSARAPEWLAAFQAGFGATLRTPLDRSTGTLRARPSSYDGSLRRDALDGPRARGDARLAVYNRQYWFRLFGLLQSAFPLTTRLLGHWTFNDHAARFLLAHPPTGWDIDRVADGFAPFMSRVLDEPRPDGTNAGFAVERAALLEAVRIDASWRSVFFAPQSTPYRPSASDAARLLAARLVPSRTVAVFSEHWPLLELRRTLAGDPSEAAVPLPPRLPRAKWWALVRKPAGIGQLPLDEREAQLFCLLAEHTVSEALARLEASCSDEERAELPVMAQTWLARSVELDFWSGLEP